MFGAGTFTVYRMPFAGRGRRPRQISIYKSFPPATRPSREIRSREGRVVFLIFFPVREGRFRPCPSGQRRRLRCRCRKDRIDRRSIPSRRMGALPEDISAQVVCFFSYKNCFSTKIAFPSVCQTPLCRCVRRVTSSSSVRWFCPDRWSGPDRWSCRGR